MLRSPSSPTRASPSRFPVLYLLIQLLSKHHNWFRKAGSPSPAKSQDILRGDKCLLLLRELCASAIGAVCELAEVTQRRVHPQLRSRMGHLDGNAPSHHCWNLQERRRAWLANMRKAWALISSRSYGVRITCRKACAQNQSAYTFAESPREEPIQVCPHTHAGEIPTPRSPPQALPTAGKSHENVLRFSYDQPGRKKRQCKLSLPDWGGTGSGSFGEIQTCNPSVKSQEPNALPNA